MLLITRLLGLAHPPSLGYLPPGAPTLAVASATPKPTALSRESSGGESRSVPKPGGNGGGDGDGDGDGDGAGSSAVCKAMLAVVVAVVAIIIVLD